MGTLYAMQQQSINDLIRNGWQPVLDAGTIDLSSQGLTSLDGINHLPANTWELDLSDNNLDTLPLSTFSGLTQLGKLDLSDNNLGTLPPGTFSGLTQLILLYLKDNNLETLLPGTFSGLRLRELNLSDNNLETLPPDTFNGLTKLLFLYLSGNNLDALPSDTFSGLTQLRELYLCDNKIIGTRKEFLELHPALKQLQDNLRFDPQKGA